MIYDDPHGAVEANFDGLIGPTHNYGGMSEGNLASARNQGLVSAPREAALQGLKKMKALADSGLVQGILPPQERPLIPFLRSLGAKGKTPEEVLTNTWEFSPQAVRQAASASSMWSANAATVSPSADTGDARLHLSPANLVTMMHRSLEHEQTGRALRAAFPDPGLFAVHTALPSQADFADEGAANHVRLAASHGSPGVEIFVYGRTLSDLKTPEFPARQTREACETLAWRHGLDPARTVFIRQSAKAIDHGAFHNDVVCVGNLDTLFFHEDAFEDKEGALGAIRNAAKGLFEPRFVEVPAEAVSLDQAVRSYLFNSQLLVRPGDDRHTLIAPTETYDLPATRRYCDSLVKGNGPIGAVEYVDVRQSMRNGGGPACLRLRVVLTCDQLAATNPRMLMSDGLFNDLTAWVTKHYREALAPNDIADPALIGEVYAALDQLTQILGLGDDFYPFQRD